MANAITSNQADALQETSGSTRALIGSIVGLLVLEAMSSMPVLGFYSRCILSFLCMAACALYGVFASIFLRIIGYGGLSQWTVARAFKWTMRFMVGVQFVIQDEHHLKTRPAVLIGNHQTKTVFIDRGNRKSAHATFDSAARMMQRERQCVFIFPEGTRSYTAEAEMLPFKKGAFHLAIQAGVPIIPVEADEMIVLPPVPTEGLTAADVDELCNRVRKSMLDELEILTEIARAQKTAIPTEEARRDHQKKS
ncbi:MAG: hypothetical protein Q9159_004647 [Coniocarpon cinnabarinum]